MRPFGLGGFGLSSSPLFNPVSMFASGEKGGIWLPEYSDVAAGSGVGTVTDISGNALNATQGTAARKPIRRNNATTGFDYWEFDDTNDFLSTAAFDIVGDAVTIFAAVRKANDGGTSCLVELGNDAPTTPGTFKMTAPAGAVANYSVRSGGSTSVVVSTASSFPFGNWHVLTMQARISTDTLTLRINGTQAATSGGDQGTGEYTNQKLWIGAALQGTTQFFGGDLAGLSVLGRAATAAEIVNVERMFATRCGAVLA